MKVLLDEWNPQKVQSYNFNISMSRSGARVSVLDRGGAGGGTSREPKHPVTECLPASLCSWNYRIQGLRVGPVSVEYNWFTEQGHIQFPAAAYTVRKHGLMSGRWTLEQGGSQIVADAQKPSALFRSFEVRGEGGAFTLKAETPFTRTFVLIVGDQIMGRIRPVHAFTRRAVLECGDSLPEELQVFAFWLVGLLWKRAAESNNNAGSGAAPAGG